MNLPSGLIGQLLRTIPGNGICQNVCPGQRFLIISSDFREQRGLNCRGSCSRPWFLDDCEGTRFQKRSHTQYFAQTLLIHLRDRSDAFPNCVAGAGFAGMCVLANVSWWFRWRASILTNFASAISRKQWKFTSRMDRTRLGGEIGNQACRKTLKNVSEYWWFWRFPEFHEIIDFRYVPLDSRRIEKVNFFRNRKRSIWSMNLQCLLKTASVGTSAKRNANTK